jgi:hypothetical protein
LKPRLWAYEQILGRRYGRIYKRGGRAHLVELERVEAAEGVKFSPTQLAAAGVHQSETGEVA